MGSRRDALHEILLAIVGEGGNVYFQPPSNIQMSYPCIIYKRDDVSVAHADNLPYERKKRYQVTVVDRDPNSELPYKVGALPSCSYDRFYAVDNLNHDVFNLYF